MSSWLNYILLYILYWRAIHADRWTSGRGGRNNKNHSRDYEREREREGEEILECAHYTTWVNSEYGLEVRS